MFSSRSAFLFLLLFLTAVAGQTLAAEPHHALVQLQLDSPGANDFIRANGGRLDILMVKPGSFAHIAAKPADMELLRASGLQMEILQTDMETENVYADKGPGYGIYHTWSETIAFVDSLQMLYPDIISEKWSIGQTLEGRDIWCFRISDNPEVDENEPEILFDAMHHCREIMASEFTIMFAEYLAQNYGTDPEISWLVDNRELYIIPVVNPDGSVYNETNYPGGGGMWRKNRRNNGDGTFGVDPNRNYPFQWGYDDVGSSPDTDSDVYRGPSAGSELEVQHLMNFINGREIRTHDTVHTYSNLTLLPWGYTPDPPVDAAIFTHIGAEMTKYNGYVYGQTAEAINYSVNGGTFDWTYGDTSEHAKIFSVSNEIGGANDGFWPAEDRREPLFQENIWPHIYLMRIAGSFVTAHSPVVTAGAKSIAPGQNGTLDFTIENQSVIDASGPVDITVKTDDPWVHFAAAERSIGSLGILGTTTLAGDPIPITVDAACPDGHLVEFMVTVHMPEGDLEYPQVFSVGAPMVLFTDDLENGLGNWTTTGLWGLTGIDYHSPLYCLTDSPNGSYPDESFTTATLSGTYNATGLSFWNRRSIELDYDYGKVQVSPDGGFWSTVATFTGSSGWEQADVDLSLFLGMDIAIRFAMDTDYSVTDDGWYIDDIVLTGNPTNDLTLSLPLLVYPGEGETTGSTPTLSVSPGAKSADDAVFYGYRIYADELCTDLVAGTDDVPETGSLTSWIAPNLPDGNYWWRAWTGDGAERTDLTQPIGFQVSFVSAVGDVVIGGPAMRVLGNVTGSSSRLELSLPGQSDVSVDIYDPRGARIRQLYTGSMAGGTRVLVWDGRDGRGQAVSSGVYFVRVNTGRETLTDRVVIVR